jgi:glycosyltransferase involved in cell wall biosynthesis
MPGPIVSVNVPCYRQLPLATRAVASVLAQEFSDFELTLFDDGAADDYREYVGLLGDRRVRYVRNPTRRGAIANMFYAITAGDAPYSLAFHEDDLLAPGYLRAAVQWLDANPRCGFVVAPLRSFQNETETGASAGLARPSATPPAEEWITFDTGADFLRSLFRGIEPMFGSVVYRRAALAGVTPRHEHYATLVDRPFLLSILERWTGALVANPPMAWYREHGSADARHRTMTGEHVLHLFETYRADLPSPIADADRALFDAYAGYWLPALLALVPNDAQPPRHRVLLRAWRAGLYDVRRSPTFGRKRLLASLLAPGRSGR